MDKNTSEPGPSRGGWFSLAALKRRGRPTDDANAQPRTVSIATLHALVQPHEATAAAKAGTAATSQVPEKPGPQLPPMPVVEASKTAEPAAAKPAEGVKRKRGRPRKQPVPTVISDEVANLAATMAADTIPLPSTQALHTEPATALTSQAIPSSTAAGKPRASAAVGALQPEVHGKAQVAAGRKTKPPSLSPSSLSSPAPAVASANKAPMPESQMLDHVRALAAAMHSKYVKNPSATPQVDTAGQTPTTSAATTALQPTQGDTAAKQTPTQDATSGPTPGSTAAVHDPAQGTASKPTKGDTAVGKKPTHGAVSKPTPGASAARQKPMPGTNSSGHKASKAGSSIKAGTSWIMLDQAAQTEALQGALHGVAEQHKADALSSQAAASSVLTSSQTPAGSDSAAQQPQPAEKRRQSQQVGALQPRPASAELPVGKLIEAVSRKDKGKHKAPLPLESATDPLSDNAADEVIDLQQEEAAAPTTAADVAGQAARQAAAAAAHSLLNDLNTKKRRGRPPKDPMKLAAALAAYAAPRAAAAAAAAHAASEAADAEIIAEAAAQAGLDVVEQYTQRYKAQQADDNRPVAFALPSTKTAKAKKKQMQAVAAASSAAQAVRDVEPQPTTASLEPLPVGTQLSNGFEATIASMDTTPAQTGPVVQKPKKKRGRPPKAVMQAAIRAADTSDVPIDPVAQAASSAPVASSAAAPLAPAAPDQTHALGATPSVHGTAGTAAAAQDAADVAMPDADSMHHLGDTAGPALAAQPVAQLPSEDAPATEQDNMPAAAAASEKPAAKKSTRKPRTKQKHLEALSSRAMALLDTLAPVSNDADLAQLNPQTQSPPQTDSQPQTQPQQTVAGAALRGIQTQAQAGASAQASDTHSDLDIPPQSGYYSGSPAKDATLSDNRHSDASETLSPADPVDMHLDTDAGDLAVGFGDMSPSRSELAEQPAGALIAMHLEDDPAQPMLELNASPPHAAPGAMNGEDVDAGQQPLTTADTAVQQGVTPDALANTSNHLVDAIATDSMPSRAPVRPSTMGVKDASQPQTVSAIEPGAPETQGMLQAPSPSAKPTSADTPLADPQSAQQAPQAQPQPQSDGQHTPQAEAPQEAQQLQQPVLAVLSNGLPPIALGNFQGDMQRARIILEAAGFLIPFDAAASMLPPSVRDTAHVPPGPAYAGGLAEQWAAIQAGQHGSEEQAEEEARHSPNGALASPLAGEGLRGAHKRKQSRGADPSPKPHKGNKLSNQKGAGKASAKPYVKRGRPSNASKAAAAAEAAARAAAEAEMAAAEHSGDDQLGSPRGVLQGFPGAPHGDAEGGLTQEEWERMGFQGQLQRVEGHDAPDSGHTAWESNAREVRRSRKPNAHLAEGHETDASRAQHGEAIIEGRHWSGLAGKRSRSDPPADPPGVAEQRPHVPRRKRSKPTELIRPLEALAAVNSAALDDRHQFEGRHYSQNSGRYAGSSEAFLTDPLSMLAAAAAESESEERARSPAQPSEANYGNRSSSQMQPALVGGQKTAPSSDIEGAVGSGEALVGRAVAKRFGAVNELFKGKVGYYAPRLCPKAPFHVQYEDGDSEDLNMQQVEEILV